MSSQRIATKDFSPDQTALLREIVHSFGDGSPLGILVQNLLKAHHAGEDIDVFFGNKDLTPNQVAVVLGVSRPYVKKLMDQQLLRFRTVGAHRRVAKSDLHDFMLRQESARADVAQALGASTTRIDAVRDAACEIDDETFDNLSKRD